MHNQKRNRAGQLAWRLVCIVLLLGLFMAGSAAPVQAGPSVFDNTIVPVSIEMFNQCAGEFGEYIDFTGSMHVLFFEIFSESGNAVYKSQVNMQGVTGVGEETGIVYQAVGMGQGISTVKDVNDVYTSVNNQRFIGRGRGSNFQLHISYHITTNANGEVTADPLNYSIECR